MQLSWPWDTQVGLGDGGVELGEAHAREFLATYFQIQNPAVEGVSKGVLGELAVSGVASPLSVQPGSAVCYGLYFNDAVVTLAVTTPVVGTTGGRVVLQTNWAGTGGAGLEARTRLAVKMSADGVPSYPSLTQSFGVTWEIPLAKFVITTGGVITLTDDRTFRKSTAMVGTGEILDNAVTLEKMLKLVGPGVIGRGAVALDHPYFIVPDDTVSDFVLTVTGIDPARFMGFSKVLTSMIQDANVTTAKIADSAVTAAKIANRTRTFFVAAKDVYNVTDAVMVADPEPSLGLGLRMPDAKTVQAYGQFAVPSDFVSTMTVAPVMYSPTSGNLRWSGGCNYGADGEPAGGGGSPTQAATTTAYTGNTRKVLPALALSAAAVGDMCSVYFVRDGANALDTINDRVTLQGWLVSYTADS